MSQLCIIVGLSFVIWPLFIQLSHGFNEDSSRFKHYTHIKTKTPASVQAQAVKDLITRLIGQVHASRFLIVVNGSFGPAGTDLDTFQYVTDDAVGKVLITGTTGVAAALGFSHFLKYVCYSHVSWSGNQITIPDPFPVVKTPVTITSPNRCVAYVTLFFLGSLSLRVTFASQGMGGRVRSTGPSIMIALSTE